LKGQYPTSPFVGTYEGTCALAERKVKKVRKVKIREERGR
jgi:hypothetical protein